MSTKMTIPPCHTARNAATAAVGLGLLGSLLLGSSAAARAAAPAGGAVSVFVTPSLTGAGGTIVLTGAIGDYGTTLTIDKNGKTDANGNYVRLTLKKGTFEVNSSTLNAAANAAQPKVNTTTCSGDLTVSDPVTVFNGTGLYAGISGTVKITEMFAFIGPKYASGAKMGQCNMGMNAQPIAQWASITGSGAVRFSS